MQAQQDAVNVVCRMKTRQNVENTVGLLSLAEWGTHAMHTHTCTHTDWWQLLSSSTQVHVTLTTDQNKIFKALQPLEPKGTINFVTAIRIAHVSNTHTHVQPLFSTTIILVWCSLARMMYTFAHFASWHSSIARIRTKRWELWLSLVAPSLPLKKRWVWSK